MSRLCGLSVSLWHVMNASLGMILTLAVRWYCCLSDVLTMYHVAPLTIQDVFI